MPFTEKVIAKPLSGLEVIDAIVHNLKVGFAKQAPKVPREVITEFTTRLKAQMKRDCYLNPILSYSVYSSDSTVNINYQPGNADFFEVRCLIKIELPNTGTNIKNTMVNFSTKTGEPSDEDMLSAEVKTLDTPKAPNEVRINTQQPVPVRSQTPQGKVKESMVKYQQKPEKAASA